MRLSSDVNLTFYAEKCDDYSGADLQALLYNAYLEAIRDVIDDSASIKQNTTKFPENKVTKFTSFAAAIEKSKPALTAAEREQIGSRVSICSYTYLERATSALENINKVNQSILFLIACPNYKRIRITRDT